MNKTRSFAAFVWALLAGLLCIGVFLIVRPKKQNERSESENRYLTEKPAFTMDAWWDGSFAESFEDYMIDHFPLRERSIELLQNCRNAVSLADWEDYAAVVNGDTENVMQETASFTAQDEPLFIPTPVPAASTAVPAPQYTPAPDAEPEDTDPSKLPAAADLPVKTPVDRNDLPKEASIRILHDGTAGYAVRYNTAFLESQAAILEAYASVLPEDGRLLFTEVPLSTVVTNLKAKKNPEAITSDVETTINALTGEKIFGFSACDILNDPILNGEYVFFKTDRHWSPRGAWYVVKEMMAAAGKKLKPFSEFTVTEESPFLGTLYRDTRKKQMLNDPDVLPIVWPEEGAKAYRYTKKDSFREIPVIDLNAKENDRYAVYLGGPGGPWTIIENGRECGDNCLLICDSFGLCSVPMLLTGYKQVHFYDPREFSKGLMGSVSSLIAEYGIKDIYLIVGTVDGFDTDFFTQLARQF